MRLIQAVQSSVWAMRPWEALTNIHLAERVLKGELLNVKAEDKQRLDSVLISRSNYSSGSNKSTEQFVSSYTIEGVITKADQSCGPEGTVSLMRRLRSNDRNPSVVGHLINIDSGGGEATNIEEVAKLVRSLTKPVVAHFNGLCCSAAYGIASGATEIYATLETDIAGSVGVMMTFADWRKHFEDKGIKIHEVYADQSSMKNDVFIQALDGNYDLLKTELLNPFADKFIGLIKEMRPATSGHDDIFKGKTFMAKIATEKGLIDGIKSKEEAVNRVFELYDLQNQNHNSTKKTQQSFQMKLFGFIGNFMKADDGSVTLTAEQFAQLEAASKAHEDTSVALAKFEESIIAKLGKIDERLDNIEKWQEETPAAATSQANPSEPSNPNPLSAINKRIAERLKNIR